MNGKLKYQKDDGISRKKCHKRIFNDLANMKNLTVMAFEHPGLYHIGEKIFKNLNIEGKLTCRLVRRSWNNMFEKQASKIDLESVPMMSKFLKEKPTWKVVWSKFLKESKTEVRIPTLVLNSYLQHLFNRMISSSIEEYEHKTPLIVFARAGNSKIVDFIHCKRIILFEDNELYEALHYAAKYGHLEILKILIDDDPKAMNIHHYTIWTAACNGKIEVMKYF